MDYTVVIRTLGTAGDYYQQTLNSLITQTIKPSEVIVYIAEDYAIPNQTIGIEKYVYVKKGMVRQRALRYDEVHTEYILFLDDDVYLPSNAVEIIFNEMKSNDGQVIAPSLFPNHLVSFKSKLRLTLLGREVPRFYDRKWGYKVLRTGGFSYNNNPIKAVYESTTNAGPCFFCRKDDFLKIHFEEELWLDKAPYAFPEDQVMFYKMHLCGLKVLTSFDSGIVHLDAGSAIQSSDKKILKVIYSEYRNKTIFWYKYIYSKEKNRVMKGWNLLCYGYAIGLQYLNSFYKLIRGNKAEVEAFKKGITDGWLFIKNNR